MIWYIHQPSTKGFCQFFQHKSSTTRALRPPHHGATTLRDDAWPSTQGLVPWRRATQQSSAAPDGKGLKSLRLILDSWSHGCWFWCLLMTFESLMINMFILFPTHPFPIAIGAIQCWMPSCPPQSKPYRHTEALEGAVVPLWGGWHEGITIEPLGEALHSIGWRWLEHLFNRCFKTISDVWYSVSDYVSLYIQLYTFTH